MNSRHDELRQIQERAALIQQSCNDLLDAARSFFLPGRIPTDPWTDEEFLTVIQGLTKLLQQSYGRPALEAFGKGDFPEPMAFSEKNISNLGEA